ncbi:MAG: hypothetical protein ACD_2C00233G0004 [uncultured bacterium (gcode 4)]|uniref:Uncharacterized protein n=1 Tax=uncultured bacterium (gcode 4) TaxID=1234023 RepID=K2FD93_9BACT|nr:MAG: hypothetical protein ACD_2C00233G0004 [uncultured bacterium (gcode 4)]
MISFKIIFLIAYSIFLVGSYFLFLMLARRLHSQNLEKLTPSSQGILEENFKRMVHYIRISLFALFISSVLFLFLIL